jgi:predicted aspartyl protease
LPHFTLTIEQSGPLVNGGVLVSSGRKDALIAEGKEVPTIRVVRALIDTGASVTSIEPAVLGALGLTPTGTIEIVTPSTGQQVHTADTYDVDFVIGGASPEEIPLTIKNLRVCSAELFLKQGIHALIGRDILSRCILNYNGATNSFSLCF